MTQRGQLMDEAWYMDYAAGALGSVGEEVLMASHLELSDGASDRVAELELIGGAILREAGDAPAEDLDFDADELLQLLDAEDARSGVLQSAPRTEDDERVLPVALKDFLDRRGKPVKWEFLGPGLKKAMLWEGENAQKLWLLKAQPGLAIPHHGHSGSELTLVLKGSFHDGDQRFGPGDVEESGTDTEHDIRIDPGEECICLALTEGKLRYKNPILKAMQVFTRL